MLMRYMKVDLRPNRRRTIGQVIDLLALIWELYDPEEMANRVEFF